MRNQMHVVLPWCLEQIRNGVAAPVGQPSPSIIAPIATERQLSRLPIANNPVDCNDSELPNAMEIIIDGTLGCNESVRLPPDESAQHRALP